LCVSSAAFFIEKHKLLVAGVVIKSKDIKSLLCNFIHILGGGIYIEGGDTLKLGKQKFLVSHQQHNQLQTNNDAQICPVTIANITTTAFTGSLKQNIAMLLTYGAETTQPPHLFSGLPA